MFLNHFSSTLLVCLGQFLFAGPWASFSCFPLSAAAPCTARPQVFHPAAAKQVEEDPYYPIHKKRHRHKQKHWDDDDVQDQSKGECARCTSDSLASRLVLRAPPTRLRSWAWAPKDHNYWVEYDAEDDFSDAPSPSTATVELEVVAWLHIFVHHLDPTASESPEVVLFVGGTCPAGPAKLVFAEATSHVVATFVLLDACPAEWTEGNVVFILFNPFPQLLIHSFFTCDIFTVPFISTFEAYPCFAFWTLKLLCILALSFHVLFASRFGTIANEWIRV